MTYEFLMEAAEWGGNVLEERGDVLDELLTLCVNGLMSAPIGRPSFASGALCWPNEATSGPFAGAAYPDRASPHSSAAHNHSSLSPLSQRPLRDEGPSDRTSDSYTT